MLYTCYYISANNKILNLFASISWSVERFPSGAANYKTCSSNQAVIEESLDI